MDPTHLQTKHYLSGASGRYIFRNAQTAPGAGTTGGHRPRRVHEGGTWGVGFPGGLVQVGPCAVGTGRGLHAGAAGIEAIQEEDQTVA